MKSLHFPPKLGEQGFLDTLDSKKTLAEPVKKPLSPSMKGRNLVDQGQSKQLLLDYITNQQNQRQNVTTRYMEMIKEPALRLSQEVAFSRNQPS